MVDYRNKGLGRLPAADPRDRQHLLAAPVRLSTRTYRTWYCTGVLDQGLTPQCVGYSAAKWVQAGPVTNRLPNPTDLYHEAQELDEWPGHDYDGSSVRGAMKALQARGVVPSYKWAFDVPTLQQHLLETGPMVLGTNWYDDMFEPDASGYLRPTGPNAGGHAYLAIGINTTRRNPDGTHGAVRILNSWGAAWGETGRAWISLTDIARLIAEEGEAAMGVEVKVPA